MPRVRPTFRDGTLPSRTKTIAIADGAFVAGAVAGGVAGLDLGATLTHRVLEPLVTASAGQAHAVLLLLDRKQQDRARWFLELQIDSGLKALEARAAKRPFAPDDPQLKLYEELKQYRETHPGPYVRTEEKPGAAEQGVAADEAR